MVLSQIPQGGLAIRLSNWQFGMDHCVYGGAHYWDGVVNPVLGKL